MESLLSLPPSHGFHEWKLDRQLFGEVLLTAEPSAKPWRHKVLQQILRHKALTYSLLMGSHHVNWNDHNHGKYNLLVEVHNLLYLENLDSLCLNSCRKRISFIPLMRSLSKHFFIKETALFGYLSLVE